MKSKLRLGSFRKNKLKPPKDERVKYSLFSFWRFAFYFCFIGFVVTCNFMMFFHQGSYYKDYDIVILNETLSARALSTLLNILFLCTIFTLFDAVNKKLTIEVPLRKILSATNKVAEGDFSVRIDPVNPIIIRNEFDIVIEDFNKMVQELATTETLKTDFISNVSHEIKTPLAAIQNYATLLQDDTLTAEERKKYASNLVEVSKKTEGLISNILKLNKLENQLIFPHAEKFNLTEQLCSCMLMFEDEWEKQNLEIITELQEDVFVEGDSELLETVWINILSNAIKFNHLNGTISLSLSTESNMAIVIISDTGCGMNEETGKHIFDKFYQGDTSRSTQGNGLGLALVKRIVDIVGAEISVKSKLGTGTRFTVKIPLNQNSKISNN